MTVRSAQSSAVALPKGEVKSAYLIKSSSPLTPLPAVLNDFNSFVRANDEIYIVKEVAIIFETKSEKAYDKIILVRAPLEERIQRVLLRDDTTRDQVIKRIKNQVDDSSIINKCDYIIDNYNLSDLKDKVAQIHADLIR